jgi:N-hydroxyarylamine O-acetyltransferase
VRLQEYLARLRVAGPLDASASTLRRLHEAHRETFLFDNLAIQEGGSISVEPQDIARKFLDYGRGGYCFEQNTLFVTMLRACGFECATLLGRVRRGPPETWARTHMVLRVGTTSGGSSPSAARAPDTEPAENVWLADVGFGAVGLVEPIPLRDGIVSHQRGLIYRLRREEPVWVLSMRDAAGRSMDLYEFPDDSQTHMDVVVANHYTSTHPDSIFRRSLTIQGVRGNERLILRSEVFSRYVNGELEEQPVNGSDLRRLARQLFEIDLPEGPLLFEQAQPVG